MLYVYIMSREIDFFLFMQYSGAVWHGKTLLVRHNNRAWNTGQCPTPPHKGAPLIKNPRAFCIPPLFIH